MSSADRDAMASEIEALLAEQLSIPAMSRYLLDPADRKMIEHGIRQSFEDQGIELYLGEDGRHGYWDGQFAQQVSEALALAMSSGLHGYLLAISPVVCPQYCSWKKSGRLDGDGFNLALSILDALLSLKVKVPLPYTHMAVYITKRSLLDPHCQCEP